MNITKNEDSRRFESQVNDGIAFLHYRIENGKIHLLYVEVPVEARGRGIAEALTRHALAYAKTYDLKVVPVCSYVIAYLQRHPEYAELLAQ